MNYRSAMIYGRFEVVPDADKAHALDVFLEQLAPERRREARPGNAKELAATTVLRIGFDEAVTKVRTGGPHYDEADLGLPVWAGVLPLGVARVAPVPDAGPGAMPDAEPDYVRAWEATLVA